MDIMPTSAPSIIHLTFLFISGASFVIVILLSTIIRKRTELPQIPWLIALSLVVGLSGLVGVVSLDLTDVSNYMSNLVLRQLFAILAIILMCGLSKSFFHGWRAHFFTGLTVLYIVPLADIMVHGAMVEPIQIRSIHLPWGEVVQVMDANWRFSHWMHFSIGSVAVLLAILFALYEVIVQKSRRHIFLVIAFSIPLAIVVYYLNNPTAFPIVPLSNLSLLLVMIAPVFNELAKSDLLAKEKEKLLAEVSLRKDELEAMLYTLSHDMRIPLLNITGFTTESLMLVQQPLEQEGTGPCSELIEYLQRVLKNSHHLSLLIQHLLDAGRHSRDALQLSMVKTEEIWQDVIAQYDWNQVQAKLVKDCTFADCFADPGRLQIVFRKVLDNCIAYAKPGKTLQINVTSRIEAMHLVIEIQDNGIGVDPEQAESLFVAFSQVTPGKERQGMGLTMSRLLLRRLGGSIHMDGKLGVGTTITIELAMHP